MAEGLKGFAGLRFFPVTTNTSSAYAVGPVFRVPEVVSGAPSRQSSDFSLPADDKTYDAGAEFSGETWAIVLREMGLENMSLLDGADYDAETGTYSWGPDKVAPILAMAFQALKRNGQYRMVKYFAVRVNSVTTEYSTKGVNQEGSNYTLNISAMTRSADGKMFEYKDTTDLADLSWLDTVDPVTVGP